MWRSGTLILLMSQVLQVYKHNGGGNKANAAKKQVSILVLVSDMVGSCSQDEASNYVVRGVMYMIKKLSYF